MIDSLPRYEVFAVKYATRDGRRAENFLFGDPHDAPMPLDYYVWLIRGERHSFVVDCGFTKETAQRRSREHLRCPVESLKLLGIDADQVDDVIVTHLHYDHIGNFHKFPKATFHLQEREMHFATGRHMRFNFLAHGFDVEDVVGMVRMNYEGRVKFYSGPSELAPGVSIHPTGGHTPGMQFVRVHTQRGWVVLSSDCSHHYEHFETRKVFPGVCSVTDALEAYDQLGALADSPSHVVPGHDPLVMDRYPPVHGLEGIAVRLDIPPR